jgi:hypothetical protein
MEMRKKLTLTIDSDVYDMIKELPRKVSISEIVSWVLKGVLEKLKSGSLTQEEFDRWIDSTPEGRDFVERAREQYGPSIRKIENKLNGIKEKVGHKKREKK